MYLNLSSNGLFQFPFVGNSELFTALSSSAGQYLTAIGSFHALTETMYGFTTLTVRLECTFHNFFNMRTGRTVQVS